MVEKVFVNEKELSLVVPSLNWLVPDAQSANVYSGSLGTDPETGCFQKVTFEYVLEPRPKNNTLLIICRRRQPFNDTTTDVSVSKQEFKLCEDGLKSAVEWLKNQAVYALTER